MGIGALNGHVPSVHLDFTSTAVPLFTDGIGQSATKNFLVKYSTTHY